MSLLGWLTGSDKALKATKKAYKSADALTREGQAKAEALLLPGSNYQPAQSKMMALLGLDGGQAQEDAFGAYRESPEVAFMREQGEGALNRTAAAGGRLASGRTLADSQKFGQGLAQQGFGDFYSRLRDLYESQKSTAGGVAGSRVSSFNRLGDLKLGLGQAKASAATSSSPWSLISGIGAIGADALGSYLGKPKTSSSIY